MEIINILGINLHKIKFAEVLKKLEFFLSNDRQYYITTPNPEIILEAQNNEEFFYILNHADLSLPDGIGLKMASWLVRANLYRVTGADLTQEILCLAEKKNKKVVIFFWQEGLSQKTEIENALHEKYPRLSFLVRGVEREGELMKLEEIDSFRPEIALVGLGAPWQERFIFNNLKNLPSVKFAIGVGGALDFITGKIKRAPKIMRALGLEWLWRIFSQPEMRLRRLKRIFNAVIKFSFQVIYWRFVLPFLYRQNVACLLFKKQADKFYILLVERADSPGHWQLPQGGLDNLDIDVAGSKELEEEIGNNKFSVKASFKNLYKYIFDNSVVRHRGAIYSRHAGYKGQEQSLLIAEYQGEDNDIKINFWDHVNWKWVESEDLVDAVHEVRKEAAKIYLKKFKEIISSK